MRVIGSTGHLAPSAAGSSPWPKGRRGEATLSTVAQPLKHQRDISVTSDDALRRTRLAALAELYDEIWEWANTKYERHHVKRKVEAVDPDSRLFIVGEAYARNQVRLSGINWFDEQGH